MPNRSHSSGFPQKLKRTILARQPRCPGWPAGLNCGAPTTEADHVVPMAEGGTDTLDNGQALCSSCHDTKTKQEVLRGQDRWRRANPKARPTTRHPGLRE